MALARARRMRVAGLAIAAFVLACVGRGWNMPEAGKGTLRWRVHPVADIPQGYQVAVADVNDDGRPDILGLSSAESLVAWFENPSWASHLITTQTARNISLTPLFREGYPVRGIALAANFALDDSRGGGTLWWAEPPSASGAEWTLRLIGQIPTSHRLRWADLDGDGRLELVNAPLLGYGADAPEYAVGAPLTWYDMPEAFLRGHVSARDAEPGAWASHVMDDSLTVVHGIDVVDWDGDGRDEILTASFEGVHFFKSSGRGGNLRWKKSRLGEGDQASRPRRGASEIAAGTIRGRRFLATIEPWHGEQVVVYFEDERGGLWNRRVIDDTFRDGHALACADLNGDGSDEIVAGYRGQGTSLYIYTASDPSGSKWARQILDTEMAASGVAIADLNGDGRLDVVAIGASTGNVKWYENLP
ncbi:MAG: VCBS repeat-containing protein [Acidobacteria bacterium]|nr:VCBS repeat-containing protein [Acidobacteriota bacterium]